MADAERARTTAGIPTWIFRVVLVLATYVLLWYAMRYRGVGCPASGRGSWRARGICGRRWRSSCSPGSCSRSPRDSRFPVNGSPRGRLVVAFVILLPPIHFTLWTNGWSLPNRVFQPWWFDTIEIAQASALLAGVAIGCGFGARGEAPA